MSVKKENNVFELRFPQESRALIHSLLKTKLVNGYSDESYRSITIQAHSLRRWGKGGSMLISSVARAIRSLSVQLNYLVNHASHTILGYNPEYIWVVNEQVFVFLCGELVVPLFEDTKTAMLSCPFSSLDFYFSPEIKRIKQIPVFIDYRTAYFSLGCLIVYFLKGDHQFYQEYLNTGEVASLLRVLDNHPVKPSKLYWLLYRCLEEEEKKRKILLI